MAYPNERAFEYTFETQTGTGATASVYVTIFDGYPRSHTVSVDVSGTATSAFIELEGSLDDSNWFSLSGTQTAASSTMFHVVNRPIRYVRMNLSTLAGGTAYVATTKYLGVRY